MKYFKTTGENSEAKTRYIPTGHVADDWYENIVPVIQHMTGTTVPAPKKDKIMRHTARACAESPNMVEHTLVAKTADVLGVSYQELASRVEEARTVDPENVAGFLVDHGMGSGEAQKFARRHDDLEGRELALKAVKACPREFSDPEFLADQVVQDYDHI